MNLNYRLVRFTLEKLRANMEDIKGEWDGDNSGALEDRAHAASDAEGKIEELEELLDELYPGQYEKSH